MATTFLSVSLIEVCHFSRILVYPPSGAGAININKSDLKRLDDKQMFNDTLIEFALKYVSANPNIRRLICITGFG